MTNMVNCIKIEVFKETDIVLARQQGRILAKHIGFSVVDQCRIATAISELARNIFLYATSGKLVVRCLQDNLRRGLEVVAIDHGPGIRDVKLAMLDGYSTSRGLGMGLPGTKRLMDEFELSSTPGVETKIVTRKWLNKV